MQGAVCSTTLLVPKDFPTVDQSDPPGSPGRVFIRSWVAARTPRIPDHQSLADAAGLRVSLCIILRAALRASIWVTYDFLDVCTNFPFSSRSQRYRPAWMVQRLILSSYGGGAVNIKGEYGTSAATGPRPDLAIAGASSTVFYSGGC